MGDITTKNLLATLVAEGALHTFPEPAIAHAILERLEDAVLMFDRGWRVAYVNERAERNMGRDRSQVLGRILWELYPDLDGTVFGGLYRGVMDGGEPGSVVDFVPRHGAWFEVRAFPTPAGLLVIARDISRQRILEAERDAAFAREREARAQAEEASRLKDEFLTTLSHELRTPLNAIVGWAHMLQGGQLGPVEQGRAIETILRNARLQTTLVEDLLDVSRIITGKLVLATSPVDVGHALQAAVEGARPTAEARGVALTIAVDPAVGEVLGDPPRLAQVLWNLISNAIKFTPAGGQVVVSAQRRATTDGAEEVTIEVRDSGEGVEPAYLPHLFERFRQVSSSRDRHTGGLGLGLAIVRHLVEAHGGTVDAHSDGLGCGATFTVRLPGITRTSCPTPVTPVPSERGALSGASVLVVDDEEDSRELLVAILDQEGAVVAATSSAAAAIEHLREQRPDVIVCDIGMPGMDGYAFIREIRAAGESGGGWVPAIALTGYASVRDSHQALLAGFQMHMGKPVDPTRLVQAIARLWRRGSGDEASGT